MNFRAGLNGVLNNTYFTNIGPLGIPQFHLQFYSFGTFSSTTRALNNYETCKKKNRPQETTHPNQHLQTSYSVILTIVASEFSNIESNLDKTNQTE